MKTLPGLRHGTEATFSCDKGYRLQGPKKIKCRGYLNWSREIPQCVGNY